jgi:DNA mismatch repair protein MutS
MRKTPIYDQYLSIKAQYDDALLLMQIGDFYEALGDDAETFADLSGCVLTRRVVGMDRSGYVWLPMAGVPHHAKDAYINKVVAAGHTVVIAAQVGDDLVNGLMPREVVEVRRP